MMKDFLKGLPLHTKLILIGSIPLLFVIYLAISLYNEKAQKVKLLDLYSYRVRQSADITRLIDQLQDEQNFSYESILKKEVQRGLLDSRSASDSIIKKLQLGGELSDFPSYAFLNELPGVRAQIDSGIYPANQVVQYFATIIFRLNTLNPVPLGARVYLPAVSADIVSQKLLSEMVTYLGITCTNLYTALYTGSTMKETLMSTMGIYEVYSSYEKEFLLKGSPAITQAFKELQRTNPMKATIEYLDRTFSVHAFDSTYTAQSWKNLSGNALEQLRTLQKELLQKVETTIYEINQKEIAGKRQALIFLVLALVLVIGLVTFIIVSINRVLNHLKDSAEMIAAGKMGLPIDINSKDTMGSLARSIDKIDRNNQALSKAAETIGKGDFSVEVNPRSKDDILGNAIADMKTNLQGFTGKLEESEKRNRLMLQVLPAAVYTCDTAGYIQQFNQAAVDLWGREPVPGKDRWWGSWKIFSADGSALSPDESPMAIMMQNGKSDQEAEFIIEKPDGTKRIILLYSEPIFNSTGNLSGSIIMLLDITDRKEAEKDIAWLAALVQSSEDAIISKTLNGVITSWNPGAEKLFGYTREEMIGQHITKLIPADRLDEETEIMRLLRNGEKVEHFDTVRVTRDNKFVDISLTISPIKNGRGEIIGASKIARDITKSKAAEEKLRQNERNLNEMANAMSQLVWIADPEGKVYYFNDRITEYRGIKKLPGGTWDWKGLIHPDDIESTLSEWSKALGSGSQFAKEHLFQMAEGSYRWHLTRVIPYKDEHENISKWIGTATDIDDMKTMALQKDDFLSVASHELRTPITSIKAYSQLLTGTYKDSGDSFLKNALSKLEVQANKMTKLVNDFLKLSKIESGKFQLNREKFCINDLVNEIAADIQFVSVNHQIVVKEEKKIIVTADRERIAQVVANFLNNAVKYSPGAEQVIIEIAAANSHVRVAVKDKGVGIKPEDHQKIFERFYRAKSNGNIPFSGFGIGLYISSEIIRRHEGEIGVDSDEGKGSTFYFTLPHAE